MYRRNQTDDCPAGVNRPERKAEDELQKLTDMSIAANWKKVIKIYTEGEIF